MQIYAQALVIGLLATAGACNALRAEQAPPSSSQPCPQDDSKGPAPPRGTPPTDNPSDRLADSKGVVCPPTGVDPDIRAKPPTDEGTIKVVLHRARPVAIPRHSQNRASLNQPGRLWDAAYCRLSRPSAGALRGPSVCRLLLRAFVQNNAVAAFPACRMRGSETTPRRILPSCGLPLDRFHGPTEERDDAQSGHSRITCSRLFSSKGSASRGGWADLRARLLMRSDTDVGDG